MFLFCQVLAALAFSSRGRSPAASVDPLAAPIEAPRSLQAPGIENFFRLSERVYSGGTPLDDAAFAALQALGIRTLVSVDGATPNLEPAHRHGLKYVHLPHGYDGINADTQARLLRAAATAGGPVFVHCHHGRHRGPAAAAIVCLGTQGWDAKRAEAWLGVAGTATNYSGLYATVRNFRAPSHEALQALPAELPEVSRVAGLVDAMVAIDKHWDRLTAIRKGGFRVPPDPPDLEPASEAVILAEHFREARRLPESRDRGPQFLAGLESSETECRAMEALFRRFKTQDLPETRTALQKSFEALAASCAACHTSLRDLPAAQRAPHFGEVKVSAQ